MSSNPEPAKLTKKFFMAAPEGLFLASNCMTPLGQTIFGEVIAPVAARQQQWERIVAVGASQRLCRIFRTSVDYLGWIATLFAPQKP
jgi:hypothetical protein